MHTALKDDLTATRTPPPPFFLLFNDDLSQRNTEKVLQSNNSESEILGNNHVSDSSIKSKSHEKEDNFKEVVLDLSPRTFW